MKLNRRLYAWGYQACARGLSLREALVLYGFSLGANLPHAFVRGWDTCLIRELRKSK